MCLLRVGIQPGLNSSDVWAWGRVSLPLLAGAVQCLGGLDYREILPQVLRIGHEPHQGVIGGLPTDADNAG